jgi:hypothetical protein
MSGIESRISTAWEDFLGVLFLAHKVPGIKDNKNALALNKIKYRTPSMEHTTYNSERHLVLPSRPQNEAVLRCLTGILEHR